MQHSRKCKLIYSNRKQISTCLGIGKWQGILKGHEKTFEGDGCVHYLECTDSFMGVYIGQNLSNYTL